MRNCLISFLLLLVFFFSFIFPPHFQVQAEQGLSIPPPLARNSNSYGFFIENKGQWDSSIKYAGDTSFGRIYLYKDKIQYQIIQSKDEKDDDNNIFFSLASDDIIDEAITLQGYIFSFMMDHEAEYRLSPSSPSSAVFSYFIGDDATKWAVSCNSYQELLYSSPNSHVELFLSFGPYGIEHRFSIQDYKDISSVKLAFDGAEFCPMQEKVLQTPLGDYDFFIPTLFVQSSQKNYSIDLEYSNSTKAYAISTIASSSIESLQRDFIHHSVILSTFSGGSERDLYESVALAPDGKSVYVSGRTLSPDLPGTSGGIIEGNPGFYQGFVLHMSPDLTELYQATYIGGSFGSHSQVNTHVLGMGFYTPENGDFRTEGSVYISGLTRAFNYPVTAGSFQSSYPGGNWNGFVTSLSPDLSTLQHSTYLGGSNDDSLLTRKIYFKGQDALIVYGDTQSLDFPITPDAFQASHAGGRDGFISILSLDLSDLLASTFWGGAGDDRIRNLNGLSHEGETDGFLYYVGTTDSPDLPGTENGFQPYPSNSYGYVDTFIAKVSQDLSNLAVATYLGGSEIDYLGDILVANDSVYVSGHTNSPDFPGTEGGFQDFFAGGSGNDPVRQQLAGDAIIARLSLDLKELYQATYWGGTGDDLLSSPFGGGMIAAAPDGTIIVAGRTNSEDLPGVSEGFQTTYGGGSWDGLLGRFSPDLTSLLSATYLGGSELDSIRNLHPAVDGSIYVVGSTASAEDFPGIFDEAWQATYGGGIWEGYVTRLYPKIDVLRVTPTPNHEKASNVSYRILIRNSIQLVGGKDTLTITFPEGTKIPLDLHAVDVRVNGMLLRVAPIVNLSSNSITFIVPNDIQNYVEFFIDINRLINPVKGEYVLSVSTSKQTIKSFSPSYQIIFIPAPHLRISAEITGNSFAKDDTAMIMVTVVNQGAGPATNTIVTMSLPPELGFLRATRFGSRVVSPDRVNFALRTLAPFSVQTFQVDLRVMASVSHMRDILVFFDVTCNENSSDDAWVRLRLISARPGNPELYLGLYFLNVQWDPKTNSVFSYATSMLEIDFQVKGAILPYESKIDWDDNRVDINKNQRITQQIISHHFEGAGKKMITISVTDQAQRTKNASINVEIRHKEHYPEGS